MYVCMYVCVCVCVSVCVCERGYACVCAVQKGLRRDRIPPHDTVMEARRLTYTLNLKAHLIGTLTREEDAWSSARLRIGRKQSLVYIRPERLAPEERQRDREEEREMVYTWS